MGRLAFNKTLGLAIFFAFIWVLRHTNICPNWWSAFGAKAWASSPANAKRAKDTSSPTPPAVSTTPKKPTQAREQRPAAPHEYYALIDEVTSLKAEQTLILEQQLLRMQKLSNGDGWEALENTLSKGKEKFRQDCYQKIKKLEVLAEAMILRAGAPCASVYQRLSQLSNDVYSVTLKNREKHEELGDLFKLSQELRVDVDAEITRLSTQSAAEVAAQRAANSHALPHDKWASETSRLDYNLANDKRSACEAPNLDGKIEEGCDGIDGKVAQLDKLHDTALKALRSRELMARVLDHYVAAIAKGISPKRFTPQFKTLYKNWKIEASAKINLALDSDDEIRESKDLLENYEAIVREQSAETRFCPSPITMMDGWESCEFRRW